MKITCEKCSAQYDLDEHRIPPSGVTMKCPACLHSFVVQKGVTAAAPAAPSKPAAARGIALSSLDDELPAPEGAAMHELEATEVSDPKVPAVGLSAIDLDLEPDLLAPAKEPSGVSQRSGFFGDDGIDLPAPIDPDRPRARAGDEIDLPGPVDAGARRDIVDLPGPVNADARRDIVDLPGPVDANARRDIVDLPGPVEAGARRDIVDLPGPTATKGGDARRGSAPVRPDGVPVELTDLPGPVVGRPRDVVDLPAPKSGSAGQRILSEDGPDLPAPKRRSARPPAVPPAARPPTPPTRPQAPPKGASAAPPPPPAVRPSAPAPTSPAPSSIGGTSAEPGGLDLDAPDFDDLSAAPPSMGMPSLDLDALDIVEAGAGPELPDVAGADAPELALSPAGSAPANSAAAPPVPPKAPEGLAELLEGQLPESANQGAAKPKRRRWVRTAVAAGAATILVGGIAVGLGLFTDAGQRLLGGRKLQQLEATLSSARRELALGTLPSYRQALLQLKPLLPTYPKNLELVGLTAEAHLGLAHLGVRGEQGQAKTLLDGIADPEKARAVPEVQKAMALEDALSGQLDSSRAKLRAVLTKAPSDAVALVYLGWIDLKVADAAAAEHAFAKAVAAEPERVAALYGLGLAQQAHGRVDDAKRLFERVLAREPAHFGARLALAQLLYEKNRAVDSQAAIEALMAKSAVDAGPKQLADAWATLGDIAAAGGRRAEAEDRLKRALAIDPQDPKAIVVLGRVRCDAGQADKVAGLLTQLADAQPGNLEVRLVLARALIETDALPPAARTVAQAVGLAPRDPRVLYWQARLELAQEKPDYKKALERLKAALAVDAKFLPAYLAESTAYAGLGDKAAALGALTDAQTQAAGNAMLLVELGESYLRLGKPVDAEKDFRDALVDPAEKDVAALDLARALVAEGRLDGARATYEELAQRAPNYPGLAEQEARLAVQQDRLQDAGKLFERALGEGVPTAALRIDAGRVAFELGELDKAKALALAVVKDDDRSAGAHLLLAEALFAQKHFEDALIEGRHAAMLEDAPEAHLAVARALEQLGKPNQALTEYALARRPPVLAEGTLEHARLLAHMGGTRDALSELATIVKDPSVRAQSLLVEGDCYSDLQMRDKARKAYQDAVKADPTLGEAAFKLARVLHDSGKRRPAIAEAERALKVAGDKASWAADAYLLLGDAHREGREAKAAIDAYHKYLQLAPAAAPMRNEVARQISDLQGS